jgi:peptidoglycan/xylan/chitin deacetylase (PgdA/CDA1 family)
VRRGDRFVLLSFDTESDQGSWTQDYTSVDDAVPRILDLLSQSGVEATFFITSKAALHNPGVVNRVLDSGHEVANHGFQHESLGEPSYFIPGDRPVLTQEIPERIRLSTEILEELIRSRPTSFRAPRGWGGESLNKALEDQGYLLDASYMLDSDREELLFPYHPDSANWRTAGDAAILEIPNAGVAGSVIDGVSSELRAYAQELAGDGPVTSIGQWPLLRLFGPPAFSDYLMVLADRQIELRGYSVLSVYQHPWEYVAMPGVLHGLEATVELAPMLYENCGEGMYGALAELIGRLRGRGFVFLTMDGFRRIWESEDDR